MNKEPVAWAMFKSNTFMDAIHPDEHARFEGGYNIPLYANPIKELTDEELFKVYADLEEVYTGNNFPVDLGRAILRKAQEK